MPYRTFALATVVVSLALAACGTPFESSPADGAPESDGGEGPVDDAGEPRSRDAGKGHDSSVATRDAASDAVDGMGFDARLDDDAGPESDAGPDADAGRQTDAGRPVDGGHPADGGHTTDAAPPVDAGVDSGPPVDACTAGTPTCAGTSIFVCGSDRTPHPVAGSCDPACTIDGRYLVGSGVVTDQSTGLGWSLAVGAKVDYASAQGTCSQLRGRLPTLTEIEGIELKTGFCHPGIDQAAFAQTPSDFFWMTSSSPALAKSFDTGTVGTPPGGVAYVRCVVPVP